MKAPAFLYVRPRSEDEAIAQLAARGADARMLAGGQSLMPMLHLRLLQPAVLLDINRLPGLDAIAERADALELGALARHARVLESPAVARRVPLLALAMPHVAHLAVRNRGTHGGSCALADPAAEIPACALALAATLVARGPRGERRIAAEDFFRGLYETALAADEMLVRIAYPTVSGDWRYGFEEIARRRGDYALVGLAAALRVDGGRVREARLGFFGIADRPVLAAGAQQALVDAPLGDTGALDAACEGLDALEVTGNEVYPSGYKRRLVSALLRRVVCSMMREDDR